MTDTFCGYGTENQSYLQLRGGGSLVRTLLLALPSDLGPEDYKTSLIWGAMSFQDISVNGTTQSLPAWSDSALDIILWRATHIMEQVDSYMPCMDTV